MIMIMVMITIMIMIMIMTINGNRKQICNRERLLFTGWISGVALRESRATSTKATVLLNAQTKYINVHQIFAERPILQTEHVTKGLYFKCMSR